ncbi:MAG: hypothetical protein AB9891_11575 [Anaerolineaceae bacterium]
MKAKKAAALIILQEGADGSVQYTVRGDALNMEFIKASTQLEAIILPWLEERAG